ncbi:hypothetical protein M885DRAFT_515229 [Pelagophyceae sp. CCMP2097]|nr:hypothetical protein M885DRAFT_515229 [Pelagophyceae sp. CCMP2097]
MRVACALALFACAAAVAPKPAAVRRRALLQQSLALPLAAALPTLASAADADAAVDGGDSVDGPAAKKPQPLGTTTVLRNGLRYKDLSLGGGDELKYGHMLTISYKAFTRATAGAPLEAVDDSDSYLVKHGNGRLIRGLDEGLHTMRVGGTRRIEVPPSLAFTSPGLGPCAFRGSGRASPGRSCFCRIPGNGRKRHNLSEKVDAVQEDGASAKSPAAPTRS